MEALVCSLEMSIYSTCAMCISSLYFSLMWATCHKSYEFLWKNENVLSTVEKHVYILLAHFNAFYARCLCSSSFYEKNSNNYKCEFFFSFEGWWDANTYTRIKIVPKGENCSPFYAPCALHYYGLLNLSTMFFLYHYRCCSWCLWLSTIQRNNLQGSKF